MLLSLNAIKLIGDIEQQAEAIVTKAAQDARELILTAQKDASASHEKRVQEELRAVAQATQDVQEKSRVTSEETVKSAESQCKLIADEAAGNMKAAISIIVGRVVES